MNYAISVIAVVIATSFVRITTAETMVVGGDNGWSVPPTATFYSDWASNHTFRVNDILVFNFFTGSHFVAEATKSAYDECDTGSVIKLHSDSPVKITLNTVGQAYFFCTVSGHCDAGQKLAVNVTAAGPPQAPAPLMSGSGAATSATSFSAFLPNPFVYLITATGLMLLLFV